jgi:hypothetical protein
LAFDTMNNNNQLYTNKTQFLVFGRIRKLYFMCISYDAVLRLSKKTA